MPRKVQLRRVRKDGANIQFNYLVDEDETISMKVYVCLLVFEFYKGHMETGPWSKVSFEGLGQQSTTRVTYPLPQARVNN